MKNTGKRIIQKILAMVVIFTMTMADLCLVGANVISYAADLIQINNENVSFNVGFKNGALETTSTIDANDLKLAIEVGVKNDGYLSNAKIELPEGTNFKFKEGIQNNYVRKIEDRAIYLNQINDGDTAKIEVGIEFVKLNNMDTDYLSKVTEIALTGKYVNSKDAEDNKWTEINGTANVKINWQSPNKINSELRTDLLTNSTYSVDGEKKNIVQFLITSRVANNSYPVKNTNIELTLSKLVEEVTVHKRTTRATNGDREFNYNYNEGKLTINAQNGQDEKISWENNAVDAFVVTMKYPEVVAQGTEITEALNNIPVKAKITTYDGKELNQTAELKTNERKDGIISISNIESQPSIGKGKLYAAEEKAYTVTSNVYVDYAVAVNEIEINEEQEANIEYTRTSIDKAQFTSIFGENGQISFKDQNGNEIETVEEDGKIIANYSKGTTSVKITTTAPQTEGTLSIVNNKKITKMKLSREEIQGLNEIKDIATAVYTKQDETKANKKAESKIILKETQSKASLSIEPITLTTAQKQDLNIKVVLETNNEERDLYKNPELRITLPKQIDSISARCSLLYGNGLKLEKGNFKIDNRVMTIKLTGEQKSYEGDAVKGATILINSKVGLNKLATNSEEKIVLNYTNENAVKYEDNAKEEVKVDIVSEDSIILTNNIAEYNVETLGNQGQKAVELNNNAEANTAKVTMKIINNEDADITNVKIAGTTANINGKIEKSGKIETNQKQANVQTNGENYSVALDNLKQGEEVDLSYNIAVAKNLPYNLSTQTGYTVTYTNSETGKEKTAEATTLLLTTGQVAEFKSSLTAKVGGQEIKAGDEVKAGEIITYTATVTNTGRENAEGVSITGIIPENTTLIELNPAYQNVVTGQGYQEYFIEKADKQIKKENVTIEAGKSVTYKCMVKVNSNLAENASGEMKLSANYKNGEVENSTFANKFVNAALTAKTIPTFKGEELHSGYYYTYQVIIENKTDSEQKDVEVAINKNDLIAIKEIVYLQENETKQVDLDGNNLTFKIDTIKPNSKTIVTMNALINKPTQNAKTADISAIIKDSSANIIRTNEISMPVVGAEVSVELKASTSSKTEYVNQGDEIKYTITVKNNGSVDAEKLSIQDRFSDYLELVKVNLNGKDVEYSEENNFEENETYNTLIIESPLKAGESATVEITGTVKEIPTDQILKVINKVLVYDTILLAETDEQAYYLETEVKQTSDNPEEDPDNPTGENKNIISGTVWEDVDQNGSRDLGEKLLEGIKVNAINVSTNKITETATTNNEGFYTLSLPKGNYIVAFEYDTGKYMATKYQKEGVSSDKNSDAITATRVVDGQEKTSAFTDSIDLTESKANIDLGLAEAKIFSLEIEKVINKMIVTNDEGTKTYDFEDSNLAKVEIAGKNLNSSNVVIEYKIKVKNTGEVAGYAKSIVDYIPSSLTFNSGLNSDWYKKGENIYTSALSNTKIEPGETKEVKLTLTKKMTESNTGLTNNRAEIESAYNSLGLPNTGAASANSSGDGSTQAKNSADAIIGVKTGSTVSYIALTLTIIVIICGAAYLINKKILIERIKI